MYKYEDRIEINNLNVNGYLNYGWQANNKTPVWTHACSEKALNKGKEFPVCNSVNHWPVPVTGSRGLCTSDAQLINMYKSYKQPGSVQWLDYWLENPGLISGRAKFFSSLKGPDQLCSQLSFLSKGYHLPSSNAEVKNMWHYTSTPL